MALAAALLVAGPASADESKGETGEKGGLGPAATGEAPAGGSGGATTDEDKRYVNPDRALRGLEVYKPWEVGAAFETHRLIRQEDVAAARSQVFNHLGLGGRIDLSKGNDRIGVYGGVFEFFLADQGESGFRADDVALFYSHYVKLPDKLTFKVSPSFTVPVSWVSQRESNITNLGLGLGVDKIFFEDFDIGATLNGGLSIDHYSTIQDGASPNAKWNASASMAAEYAMPFLRDLSIGADAIVGYVWFYEPGSAPNPEMSVQMQQGATETAGFTGQPVEEAYGGEVFARYLLPEVDGFSSSLSVFLANGDPTLGYVGAIHDGVSHVYLAYRDNAEVYVALAGRY